MAAQGPPDDWAERLTPLTAPLQRCRCVEILWGKLRTEASALAEAEAAAWLVQGGCEEVAFVSECKGEKRPDIRAVLQGQTFWVEVKELEMSRKSEEQQRAGAAIEQHVEGLRVTGRVDVVFPGGLLPGAAGCLTVHEVCCYATQCLQALGGASPPEPDSVVFVHPSLEAQPLAVVEDPDTDTKLMIIFCPGPPGGRGKCLVVAVPWVDRSLDIGRDIDVAAKQLANHQPGLMFLRVLDPGVRPLIALRQTHVRDGQFRFWRCERPIPGSVGALAVTAEGYGGVAAVLVAPNPQADTPLPDCVREALEGTAVTMIARGA